MKPLRFLILLLTAVLVVVVGCSDESPTTGPDPSEQPMTADMSEQLGVWMKEPATSLLSCPETKTYSVTQEFGPDGGMLQIGPHVLYIPRGALLTPVTITATAPAGEHAEIRFEPHGLQFQRPTVLTMSYRNCALVQQLLPPRIVYADSGRAIVETLLTVKDGLRQTVSTTTNHFSGYLLAE